MYERFLTLKTREEKNGEGGSRVRARLRGPEEEEGGSLDPNMLITAACVPPVSRRHAQVLSLIHI